MAFSQNFWARRGAANWALLPLSALFGAAVWTRRSLYRQGVLRSFPVSAPVAVVGNVTAGGGGKTPIVIALAEMLLRRGRRPGVASRGAAPLSPLMVDDETPWDACGDEPLLIRRRTGAEVSVSASRAAAAQALAAAGCDIVICDDGMQHYALRRDMEICAVSAGFGLGNGWLLPAGPLREPRRRLDSCDRILATGAGVFAHPRAESVSYETDGFYAAAMPGEIFPAARFAGRRVAAVAGIAHPERFFDSLRAAGIRISSCHALPDHGRMPDSRLAALDAEVVLMTEKDAVKYDARTPRLHVMKISARLSQSLEEEVCALKPGDGSSVR